MDKQYLNKQQLENRIKKLNDWLIQNPNDPMAGTAKNEVFYYIDLLSELEESIYPTILNECPFQIYQQIGVLL
ncbi:MULTISPECIES: hypothetical protein [Empedobacter]|uniref:hypothetical protein n=1 Tax=Empedobacter TaxID=59734 RepID=UPI000E8AC064|nr:MULTISPECIES: hypothetical protein [Empedobacter]MDM1042161.1 hypothetical protein [Empedobacter brevis]MDM1135965.1 hypothetical protein [Empedobacter sp. R750]HBX61993.1 hypothetical protein [Flavobacteriaceae bacterium]